MEPTQPPVCLVDTALRHKIREYARQQRKDLRSNTTDALRFGLGQIKTEIKELENLGINNAKGLAKRIKRRKHATFQDMYQLSHAFLQGNDNINAFAQIPGAIQVIVKELTGAQVERQIAASECLCNLSLGEAHVCEKITTLAGSYLVTYLNSQDAKLKRSCLWTLANLLATCTKSAKILLQMQLATTLWKLYTDDTLDYQEDAGICLYLIGVHAAAEITQEDRRYIAEHLHQKPSKAAAEYYFYIIFQYEIINLERDSCAKHFQHLYKYFVDNLGPEITTAAEQMRTFYGIRVLSNVFAAKPTIQELQLEPLNLIKSLNQLFALKDASFTRELLQMLRNLMELQLLDNEQLLDQLQVYDCPITA